MGVRGIPRWSQYASIPVNAKLKMLDTGKTFQNKQKIAFVTTKLS